MKKEGGSDKSQTSIDKFVNFINRARMLDLSPACSGFTWSNRRYGEDFIRERLDRFLATEQWRNLYA